MAKNKSLIRAIPPQIADSPFSRAIVSPCTGCQNNIPVPMDDVQAMSSSFTKGAWPCPKAKLARQKSRAESEGVGDKMYNFKHPIFDIKLKGQNPIWPGDGSNGENKTYNRYPVVWIATFEDNYESGWNPTFDTASIICRDYPYLILGPERLWNANGRVEQNDGLFVLEKTFYIDGAPYGGFVMETAAFQISSGYKRKIDKNLNTTTSGARP